jgi:hypothetical protein
MILAPLKVVSSRCITVLLLLPTLVAMSTKIEENSLVLSTIKSPIESQAPKYPDSKFLLITSAFHQRRALGCFRKQGLNCDAFSADLKTNTKTLIINFIAPDSENIALWQMTIKEIVGYWVYKMKGYL